MSERATLSNKSPEYQKYSSDQEGCSVLVEGHGRHCVFLANTTICTSYADGFLPSAERYSSSLVYRFCAGERKNDTQEY
jgi:hypothetical protein